VIAIYYHQPITTLKVPVFTIFKHQLLDSRSISELHGVHQGIPALGAADDVKALDVVGAKALVATFGPQE